MRWIILFVKLSYFCGRKQRLMKRGIKQYLLTAFLLVGMSLGMSAKDFVVVIDAGHGGKDVGAVGDKAREKDVNLGVALKLGANIAKEHTDVKVVYTRDDDTFISLQERANIANRAKGDLFISIHTNSIDKRSKRRYSVAGAETYTLGLHRTKENFDVAKRENSVIALEDDYSVKYQGFDPNSTESYIIFELNQSKHMEQSVNFASLVQDEFAAIGRIDKGVRQAGFWVLAATSMPAVLVELDFICNPTQEAFLASSKGQSQLAEALFNAFCQYKEEWDYYHTDRKHTEKKPDLRRNGNNRENADNREEAVSETEYRIQFMSSSKKLPDGSKEFRGLDNIDYYRENGLYKYTTGPTADKDEALKNLKKVKSKFKDAFLVEFKNGKRIK